MSSTFRALETADDFGGDLPAQDALARRRPAAGSRADAESGHYQIFLYVLLVYLFMYVSRIPELVPWFRIGLLLIPILLVGLVMTQKVWVLLRCAVGALVDSVHDLGRDLRSAEFLAGRQLQNIHQHGAEIC